MPRAPPRPESRMPESHACDSRPVRIFQIYVPGGYGPHGRRRSHGLAMAGTFLRFDGVYRRRVQPCRKIWCVAQGAAPGCRVTPHHGRIRFWAAVTGEVRRTVRKLAPLRFRSVWTVYESDLISSVKLPLKIVLYFSRKKFRDSRIGTVCDPVSPLENCHNPGIDSNCLPVRPEKV